MPNKKKTIHAPTAKAEEAKEFLTGEGKPFVKLPPKQAVTHPKETGPFACQYDRFPDALEVFAEKQGITPLKWREQGGEYILFSEKLQKYHIPKQ